jgi:hypothetical protein
VERRSSHGTQEQVKSLSQVITVKDKTASSADLRLQPFKKTEKEILSILLYEKNYRSY